MPRYVAQYTDEMYATLLLPAGVTSEASIMYKDEEKLLIDAKAGDAVYVNQVLPEKMAYNLKNIANFSLRAEIITMTRTVRAMGS